MLTAGLGTRLHPLSQFLPKPLLPVAGRPLVAQTLSRLAALGCGEAALNLHHKGDLIRQEFGGAFDGMSIRYSEEKELLGTMGAATAVREFLADSDVALVVNGDSLCRWPFERLLRRHLSGSAAITVLLSKRADPSEFDGGVGVGREGGLVSTGRTNEFGIVDRRRVFAGVQALAPEVVRGLDKEPADFVADLWIPRLERGESIGVFETRERWFDLGTPGRYLEAVREWGRGHGPLRLLRPNWISPGATIQRGARIKGSVVESGARIEAGAEVEDSLLLPGSRVRSGTVVRRSILGFDAALPSEAQVEGRLITVVRADVQTRPEDSVVGGLVYGALFE